MSISMSILMFNDFESPISVLGVWRPHVCPKSFVFYVLLNLSFYCHIWICPFSHLRRPLFCVMILYSICNKTHHVPARSGPANRCPRDPCHSNISVVYSSSASLPPALFVWKCFMMSLACFTSKSSILTSNEFSMCHSWQIWNAMHGIGLLNLWSSNARNSRSQPLGHRWGIMKQPLHKTLFQLRDNIYITYSMYLGEIVAC